ncbi:putative F-box protein At5g60060 [Syzygium oleosum]|uniref:putative F-box protein At5g60060 n=1 Tax=Syzygium oleosum TaxID=219896 RepID=UPI0024BBDCBE|nr:putative F-box protein At5g60060 [Syzygium oleosum]
MDPTERPPLSDHPPEILSMIGMRLDDHMDVLRFCSVFPSLRSSFRRWAAPLPLRNPTPQRPAVFLRASTVCTLETPEGGAASGRARWLLKLEEAEPGRMRILSLFSQRKIAYLPPEFPRVLDSPQFRIVAVCRQYTLDDGRGTEGLFPDVQKVVMHPDSVWSDLGQCLVYFIDGVGQLGYWKYGDENCSHVVDPQGCGYDDIVVYGGKVCVVDESGSVWQIDSSFRLQSFSPPIYCANCRRGSGSGYWMHLVVSSGDLYVVERYVKRGAHVRAPMRTANTRVYRLDRRFGGRWEKVSSLGNSAFFLCKHCSFVVPARELGGLDGNCIYYAEEEANSYFSSEDVKVFSLADGSIRSLGSSDFLLDMTARH